jgi:hypothetical protein
MVHPEISYPLAAVTVVAAVPPVRRLLYRATIGRFRSPEVRRRMRARMGAPLVSCGGAPHARGGKRDGRRSGGGRRRGGPSVHELGAD